MIVSVCVLLIVAVTSVLSDVDYCDLHTFANYKQTDNDHQLHFNKEKNPQPSVMLLLIQF